MRVDLAPPPPAKIVCDSYHPEEVDRKREKIKCVLCRECATKDKSVLRRRERFRTITATISGFLSKKKKNERTSEERGGNVYDFDRRHLRLLEK